MHIVSQGSTLLPYHSRIASNGSGNFLQVQHGINSVADSYFRAESNKGFTLVLLLNFLRPKPSPVLSKLRLFSKCSETRGIGLCQIKSKFV